MKYTDSITGESYVPYKLPVKVLKSAAGFYIGQCEPSGCPFSRLSTYYFQSEKEAQSALRDGFTPRFAPENTEVLRDLIKFSKLVVLSAPQGSVVRTNGVLVRLGR